MLTEKQIPRFARDDSRQIPRFARDDSRQIPRFARNDRTWFRILTLALLLCVAPSCGKFQEQADKQFGDQNFKSAIAFVELYRVRHGEYPAAITDIDFIGDWDRIWMSAVEYKRLPDGYELNVTRGWVGQPTLSYPPEFWHGLGLRRSNMLTGKPAT